MLSSAASLLLGQHYDACIGRVMSQSSGLRIGTIDLFEDQNATPKMSRVQLPFFVDFHGF
jgi:hypothetical protein